MRLLFWRFTCLFLGFLFMSRFRVFPSWATSMNTVKPAIFHIFQLTHLTNVLFMDLKSCSHIEMWGKTSMFPKLKLASSGESLGLYGWPLNISHLAGDIQMFEDDEDGISILFEVSRVTGIPLVIIHFLDVPRQTIHFGGTHSMETPMLAGISIHGWYISWKIPI